MKKCSVENCNNKFHSNKYCRKHYMQMYHYGKIKRSKYDPNEIILHEDFAEIILYDNKNDNIEKTRAIIDLDDVDKCKQYKWRLNGHGYVLKDSSNESSGFIHRFLMNINNENIFVDHKNRNKLDNRKSNLRLCTQQENNFNIGLSSINTSGIIGVSWDKSRNKWMAHIKKDYKRKYLGRFSNKEEAIRVRLLAELKYFGEFAPQQQLFEQYGIRLEH